MPTDYLLDYLITTIGNYGLFGTKNRVLKSKTKFLEKSYKEKHQKRRVYTDIFRINIILYYIVLIIRYTILYSFSTREVYYASG